MAKGGLDIESRTRGIIEDIRGGKFAPVYLLMGDEPFYPDRVCAAIMENAVEEGNRDFDQFVFYGLDADASDVITAARGCPMFGGRVLVVLKEAQQMKSIEALQHYVEKPVDSTVLVILMHNAGLDKRKALYKAVSKCGVVVDSPALKDYQVVDWIPTYYSGRGLHIDPRAAQLLAEYVGTDLCAIAVETDKLVKALPEGRNEITLSDVESNVGLNRQFSVFELTKALSYHKSAEALRVCRHLARTAKFYLPVAISALATHFTRILRYEALLMKTSRPSPEDKAAALSVNPYFYQEYENAIRVYPLQKTMAIISLLSDYDFKGKGDACSDTDQGELLIESVTKILNL